MEKKEILGLSAVALASAIKEGKTTAPGAVQAVLEQIEETEKKYHCYVTIDAERAMKTAIDVQNKIESGELTGPLAGVPMAVKDNLCTEGLLTTCSSKMLGNFVPAYTAEAVLRLQKAGAILIGKTNMVLTIMLLQIVYSIEIKIVRVCRILRNAMKDRDVIVVTSNYI